MASITQTLFVEGSVTELVEQISTLIDSLGSDQQNIQSEVAALAGTDVDGAITKIVSASVVLNKAVDKDIIPAYNLLVYLIHQTKEPASLFTTVLKNISDSKFSADRPAVALSIVSSIFNLIPEDDVFRYDVLLASVEVVRASGSFEQLKTQLKKLPAWLAEWQVSAEAERKLYLAIYEAADAAGDREAFTYLVAALRSFSSSETTVPAARELAVKAIKAALRSKQVYDFNDLLGIEAAQALRQSDSVLFELLDIFVGETREEFDAFQVENPGWMEKNDLDAEVLTRKINLLTLTSLAASASQTRSLPHETIAKALKVPIDEVEVWVIDVIRAGLVEGKLSQSNKTFLIHRTTYRVFGDKQWQDIASRLDVWRSSLTNVLSVIRAERANLATSVEQAEADARNGGSNQRRLGGNRGPRRDYNNNNHHGNNNRHRDDGGNRGGKELSSEA